MKTIYKIASSVSIVCTSLLLSSVASAEWTGNVSGQQIIDGSDQGSRIRFEASNNKRPFTQNVYVDYLNRDVSGSAFAIGYEPSYWFTEKGYVFGTAVIGNSGDDAIEYITTLGGGIGYNFLATRSTSLSGEIGLNRRAVKFDEDIIGNGDDTADAISTFANLTAEQTLTDIIKLTATAGIIDGETNRVTTGSVGAKLRIAGGSIVYRYTVRNDEQDFGDTVESEGSSISFEYGF